MATFSIKSPQGTFEVTAPDEQSAMEAFQSFQGGGSDTNQRVGGAFDALPGPEPQGMIGGLVDSFTSGITGRFGDEITAAESALLGRQPGGGTFDLGNFEGTFGERFDAALAAERGQQEQFREDNPILSTGAEIAGAISPLAAAGIGANTVRGAAGLGAAEGALFGAGDTEGGLQERAQGAALGAPVGAIGGAVGQKVVAPLVEKGVRAVAPVVGRVGQAAKRELQSLTGNNAAATAASKAAREKRGVEFIIAKAKEVGLEPDEFVKRIKAGEVLGQQDAQLTKLATDIRTQKGSSSSSKIIDDTLNEGFGRNQKRVGAETRKMLGGQPNFTKWLNGFKKAEGKKANAAYEAAYNKPLAIPAGQALDLAETLPRVPSSALDVAKREAQIAGEPFGANLIATNEAGELVLTRVPNLREVEQIRRGLKSAANDAFSKPGEGGIGVKLRTLEQEWRKVIDKASPALKKTRANFATQKGIEEAAETGLTLLNKRPDVIEVILEGANKQEMQAIRNGVVANLEDMVDRGQINSDSIKKLFGTGKKRKTIEKLFQNPKQANKFFSDLEKMANFNAMRSTVTGGSQTADKLLGAQELEAGGMLESAISAAMLDFKPAARQAVTRAMKSASKALRSRSPEELDAMAKMLVGSSQEVRNLMNLAGRGNPRAVSKLNSEVAKFFEETKPALAPAIGGVTAGEFAGGGQSSQGVAGENQRRPLEITVRPNTGRN